MIRYEEVKNFRNDPISRTHETTSRSTIRFSSTPHTLSGAATLPHDPGTTIDTLRLLILAWPIRY